MNLLTRIMHQAKGIVPTIALVFLLLPTSSKAQLAVKENTMFSIKRDVASKANVNAFQSDISGTATLFLNGQDQTLYMSEGLSMPNLAISDGSQLQIASALHIKGNLTLENGTLVLNHPLKVDGIIKQNKKASILNSYWIIQNKDQIIAHNGITANKTNAFSPVVLYTTPTVKQGLLLLSKQNNTTLQPVGYKTIYNTIIKPPPQLS